MTITKARFSSLFNEIKIIQPHRGCKICSKRSYTVIGSLRDPS
jgi:hypothetical protein